MGAASSRERKRRVSKAEAKDEKTDRKERDGYRRKKVEGGKGNKTETTEKEARQKRQVRREGPMGENKDEEN